MTNIIPGRCYYPKRIGIHWEVWFCHSDESADPASGATEWKAVTTRFWRWITAARIANEIWSAFNDGIWVEGGRREQAAQANANCIICANGNDLPEGEHCRACGREGEAFGLRAAVIKARGRYEPPSKPVQFGVSSPMPSDLSDSLPHLNRNE